MYLKYRKFTQQLISSRYGKTCTEIVLILLSVTLCLRCVMMLFLSTIICIIKIFRKIKLVLYAKKIETVCHLFIECSIFVPLNKIVLYLLRRISNNTITLSEKVFRFFELPQLDTFSKQYALILLSESRHLIWICRNLTKHEKKSLCSIQVIFKFFNKLKIRILADKSRLPFEDFFELWCAHGVCGIDLTENKVF